MNKKDARVRRSRKTRVRIAEQRATRLVVGRSNSHIYAQIIAPTGDKVLASASTLEADGTLLGDTHPGFAGAPDSSLTFRHRIVLFSFLRRESTANLPTAASDSRVTDSAKSRFPLFDVYFFFVSLITTRSSE